MKKGSKLPQNADRLHHYAKTALNFKNWIDSGNRLQESMQIIAPSIDTYFAHLRSEDWQHLPEYESHYIFLMLGGYAIECFCKGFLIERLSHPERAEIEAGRYPKSLSEHKIEDYLDKVGFAISDIERELARRVERSVNWGGRYPIPKFSDDLTPTIAMGTDVKRLFLMLDRLRRHVGGKKSYCIE